MRITTILTPAEIVRLPESDLAATTAVVFDVLRATSTITTALASGVAAVYPAKDIAEAWALREIHPQALLGGERYGEKIDGFDLGNSPLEYQSSAGREIITTTTNGTLALRAVAYAGSVIAGSLLNIAAIAALLLREAPEHLLLVCAGTGDEFAIEDGLGAGALVAALSGKKTASFSLDDASLLLLELWKAQSAQVYDVLAGSTNGRRLLERGRADEVAWCAQVDHCQAVGVLKNGRLQKNGSHLEP